MFNLANYFNILTVQKAEYVCIVVIEYSLKWSSNSKILYALNNRYMNLNYDCFVLAFK